MHTILDALALAWVSRISCITLKVHSKRDDETIKSLSAFLLRERIFVEELTVEGCTFDGTALFGAIPSSATIKTLRVAGASLGKWDPGTGLDTTVKRMVLTVCKSLGRLPFVGVSEVRERKNWTLVRSSPVCARFNLSKLNGPAYGMRRRCSTIYQLRQSACLSAKVPTSQHICRRIV